MKAETGERPHPIPITVREALNWATLEGARTFRLEDRTGSLEVGKAADIITLRANDLNMSGAFDPYNAVVGFAHPGNIDTVIVGGVIHKTGGKMLRGDLADLQAQLAESGARIFKDFKAKAATSEFA